MEVEREGEGNKPARKRTRRTSGENQTRRGRGRKPSPPAATGETQEQSASSSTGVAVTENTAAPVSQVDLHEVAKGNAVKAAAGRRVRSTRKAAKSGGSPQGRSRRPKSARPVPEVQPTVTEAPTEEWVGAQRLEEFESEPPEQRPRAELAPQPASVRGGRSRGPRVHDLRPARSPQSPSDRESEFTSEEPDEEMETEVAFDTEAAEGELSRGRESTWMRRGAPSIKRVERSTDRDQEVGPEDVEDDEESKGDGANRRMLINVSGGDECRVAVLRNGRLEELFIERASTQSHVGNIYKGRITNVEPSIQAVFVDFGLKKDGFLHISDVQPQYFPDYRGPGEEVGRKIPRHLRPPIQRCFRRGQEVIVQVTKEGVGTKGPTLTTYLSIPGRFLVMMPGMHHHGVSRKIEDDDARRKMRDVMKELKLPAGMGFILRTAGLDRTKRDLQRDLNYLLRLWRTVADRVRRMPSPAELYRESDLVTRTIRDVYTLDFERIIVDDAETARQVQEFIQIAMPRSKTVVELYSAREPIFHRYGIEGEIERINMRHVPLPSGGSLVIDSTEALVAIDVNSGRFRSIADAEELSFRNNMEAAVEIARQLRLRDLGGLIICDFIDMRQERHMRAVERKLRDELKDHKERARILRMSAFGIIEMTRQRRGPSLKRNLYDDCPHCKGSGFVKMPESIMLDAVRMIQLATHHQEVQKVTITLAQDVAVQILNSKRALMHQIEGETGKTIFIRGEASFTGDHMELACEDAAGRPVTISTGAAPTTKHDRQRMAL